jgi:sugar lactone lactonase YvrE
MLNGWRSCVGNFLFAAVIVVSSVRLGATDIIQTIAGGGNLENYKPLEANLLLGTSAGVAVNALGEVLVSDSAHNQVLKINPTTGLITIVAGNGTAAYFGDGTPAPSAGLNAPGGLAFDAAGNLFIADRGNFTIRRVDALSGVITTVAGNGLFTGQVVGTNPAAPLGDGLAATSATFGTMGDITIDAGGAIIVADTSNQCVRKFTVGGTIATIAGTPNNGGFAGDGAAGGALTAQFNNPTGVVVDGSGNLFIADSGNRRVRKLDSANTVTTVAGSGGGAGGFDGDGGAATSAQIGSLGGLAFKSGVLLISCVGANRIRSVDVASATPIILTIAGNGATTIGDLGPATGAALSGPRDIAVDAAGNVFIYDSGFGRIRRIDAITGFIDTVIGTGLRGFIGDRGPNQGGVLVGPKGAAFDANGNLYVADTGNNAVRKVALDGTITTFAGNGAAAGLGDGGPAILASLSAPADVTVVGTALLIADNGHNAIRSVDLGTNVITTYVAINRPVAMVADAAGVLYVAHDNQVDTVAVDKTVTTYVGGNPVNTVANPNGDGLPPDSARVRSPSGLALGPGGELYIADTNNDLVRMISAGATPITSTIAGGGTNAFPSVGDGGPALSATLSGPTGVTIDAAGRLVISDTNNHRIRVVDLTALTITTLVGNGTSGFTGDGDVITSALVNFPGKVFVNAGSLVFVDVGNNRVRKIISATDMDPKLLSFSAKLAFTIDKKTGQLVLNKDAVALKAGLPLPAGIAAANLKIAVDIIDLHQQIQLDSAGKMPKAVKAAKASKVTPVFSFALPHGGPPPVSKFSLALKGTSVAGGKPASFSFASKGTFREELGRAGFTDVTTPKEGVNLPVRVDITLGTTVFTGLTTVQWKATQGKGGAAKSIKTK